jgi:hypothetical protein
VKVKDKPTADALAVWYAALVAGPGPVVGQMGLVDANTCQDVYKVDLDLVQAAAPDPPKPLAEWLEAFQALQPGSDTTVHGEPAFRFLRANQALMLACEEGVTT